MSTAVQSADPALFRARNFVFLLAILAMNYTLSRPSPVDFIFVTTLLLSLFVRQEVILKFVLLSLLLTAWAVGFVSASLPHLGELNVPFELLAKTFSISIAVIGAFVAMSWRARHFHAFMKVYIVSALIASTLGIVGFAFDIELLTWDDRAKGLIDDPNMYGSFLIPAVLFCVYRLNQKVGSRAFVIAALPVLGLGILLSFSRIATVAALVCMVGYLVFLSRLRLTKLLPMLFGVVIFGLLVFALAYLASEDFARKFFERLTLAESYDLGREGRYARYLLVLPMILENPMGLGVLQLEKVFPEPIHNIFLSSFVNYGWLGGFTWLALFSSSMVVSVQDYRRTRNPLVVLLMFSFLSLVMSASFHEGEHWRHLWLFLGLLWGFNARNFPLPQTATRSVRPPAPVMWPAGAVARTGRT
jgi:hypothetical protein